MGDVEKPTPAQRNREQFPEFAAFVDTLRAKFGDVKVTYAENKETGVKLGKSIDERIASGEFSGAWNADQWLRMGQPLPTHDEVMERAAQDQRDAEAAIGKKGRSRKR